MQQIITYIKNTRPPYSGIITYDGIMEISFGAGALWTQKPRYLKKFANYFAAVGFSHRFGSEYLDNKELIHRTKKRELLGALKQFRAIGAEHIMLSYNKKLVMAGKGYRPCKTKPNKGRVVWQTTNKYANSYSVLLQVSLMIRCLSVLDSDVSIWHPAAKHGLILSDKDTQIFIMGCKS